MLNKKIKILFCFTFVFVGIILFRVNTVEAAIGFNATSSAEWNGGSSVSFSHTISGSQPVLLVETANTSQTVTTVSYAGVNMIRAICGYNSTRESCIWSLAKPTTGTNTVVVTAKSSGTNFAIAVSFTGGDSFGPLDGQDANASTASVIATVIVRENVDTVQVGAVEVAGNTTVTPDPGESMTHSTTTSGEQSFGSYADDTALAYTLSELIAYTATAIGLIPDQLYEAGSMVATSTHTAFCYTNGTASCFDGSNAANIRAGFRSGVNFGDIHTGFYFSNISILQGSTIDAAYFRYTAYDTDATTDNIFISAEDVDDASPFVTVPNTSPDTPKNKVTTTAAVLWTLPNQTVEVHYQSPDIKSVIQEIIDRPGWVSGNDIAIIIRSNAAAENHNMNPCGTAGQKCESSVLWINFTAPTGYCGHTGGDWFINSDCWISTSTTTQGIIYIGTSGKLNITDNAVVCAAGLRGRTGTSLNVKAGGQVCLDNQNN